MYNVNHTLQNWPLIGWLSWLTNQRPSFWRERALIYALHPLVVGNLPYCVVVWNLFHCVVVLLYWKKIFWFLNHTCFLNILPKNLNYHHLTLKLLKSLAIRNLNLHRRWKLLRNDLNEIWPVPDRTLGRE